MTQVPAGGPFSASESAEILGVSTWTIYRMVRDGRLASCPTWEHRVAITRAELERFATHGARKVAPVTSLQRARRCGGQLLPLGPLEDALGGPGASRMGRLLGVHHKQVHRWRHDGLSWLQADILAVRTGRHPSAVWGDAWWQLSDAAEDDDLTQDNPARAQK